MSASVADRVIHRLPRPIKCDHCGGPRVHLQHRKLMGLRIPRKWDLIWHCLDCCSLVGCHEGTDIPLGLMADVQTRAARFEVHQAFDRLWRGGGLTRLEAYTWMARALMLPPEQAHIGMLSQAQCEALTLAVKNFQHTRRHDRHWKQNTRKKRRS